MDRAHEYCSQYSSSRLSRDHVIADWHVSLPRNDKRGLQIFFLRGRLLHLHGKVHSIRKFLPLPPPAPLIFLFDISKMLDALRQFYVQIF